MRYCAVVLAVLVLSLALALPGGVSAQQKPAAAAAPAAPGTAAPKGAPARTKEWKIRNATSAAPRSVSRDATVIDYPGKAGGEMPVLRKGTNGWTCLPDDPSTPANDPMCLDGNAMAWAQAWMSKGEPKLAGPGLGYMLQGGGSASNTDPHATKPAAGATWLKEAPHVMVFPTGKLDPQVYGTDPKSGRPWIMWAGTPYEHLMMPVR